MDMTAATTMISTVGFPIAACCVMFWYMNKERESHAEEIKSLTDTINTNTIALTELKDAIGKKEVQV